METQIRGYKPSDLSACRALWAELTDHHRAIYQDPTIGGENPGLAFDEHLAQVGEELTWVATSGEDIVGLTCLAVEGEQAEVEPVIVTVPHRGRGVGRQLVVRAIEEAKKLGILCLSAKPVARNTEAMSFFYESGFRILGHVQMFMWLGTPHPGQWKRGPTLYGKQFDC